jgi:hypothetical protein
LSGQTEANDELSLSSGQWSMRSLLLATAIVALALGIWRSDGNLGLIFAFVAAPSMIMSWAERFFRLQPADLLRRSLDVFMATGAVLTVGYSFWLIIGSIGNGYLGSALCQIVLAAALGAAAGVAYCLLVIAFYGVTKCITRW